MFYLLKLTQFVGNTVFGVKMFQSNMTAVILAALGLFTLGKGSFATISTILLILDAYIGLALYTQKYSIKIQAFLGGFKKFVVVQEETGDDEHYIRA